MNKKGNEKPKLSEGQEVVLTRVVQGVVKGARGTIIRIHPQPRFDGEANLHSVEKPGGKDVANLHLQTGAMLENVPLDAIKTFTRK